MTYVTDVGTTTRLRMTKTRTLQAWERTKGICVICEQRIDGVRQQWFVEHIRALELGGQDVAENLGPAHYACKSIKDADDHRRAAKAKEAKRRQLGIQAPDHPTIQSQGFARSRKSLRREEAAARRRELAAIVASFNPSLGRVL